MPGEVELGLCRNLDRHTVLSDQLVAAQTFPVVAGLIELRIGWHLDRHTAGAMAAVPEFAHPSLARIVELGPGGRHHLHTGVARQDMAEAAFPACARGIELRVRWHGDRDTASAVVAFTPRTRGGRQFGRSGGSGGRGWLRQGPGRPNHLQTGQENHHFSCARQEPSHVFPPAKVCSLLDYSRRVAGKAASVGTTRASPLHRKAPA
jgi:hypothetical protein